MQSTTLTFPHSARTTYTAIRHLFQTKRTRFSGIRFDDDLLVVEARHGAWLSPFSEKVRMKVVATGTQSCQVVIESSSRTVLNLLNFGANKGNVNDLAACIGNEAYRLCQPGEIAMAHPTDGHSTIRMAKPEIRLRK